MADDKVKKVRR